MTQPELKTEQEIVRRFGELRNNVNAIWSKLNDLKAESQEHELVCKALEEMDTSRKCYRYEFCICR